MSTACSIILLLLLSLLHAMLLSLGAACSVMERLISQTNLRVLKVMARAVLLVQPNSPARASVRSSVLGAVTSRSIALVKSLQADACSSDVPTHVEEIIALCLRVGMGESDPTRSVAAIGAIVGHLSSPSTLQAVNAAVLKLSSALVPAVGGMEVLGQRRAMATIVQKAVSDRVQQLARGLNERGVQAGGHPGPLPHAHFGTHLTPIRHPFSYCV